MGRLLELIERKAKADTLPPKVRAQYAAVYAALNEDLTGILIDLALACDSYTQIFIADPDNMSALIEAAQQITKVTGDTK